MYSARKFDSQHARFTNEAHHRRHGPSTDIFMYIIQYIWGVGTHRTNVYVMYIYLLFILYAWNTEMFTLSVIILYIVPSAHIIEYSSLAKC